MAVGGEFVGVVFIADAMRPGARQALAELKASGVKRIVMLTGDNASTARAIAAELGIDEVHADLMPEDKVSAIAQLQAQGHRVAMVGDGINDAPALAKADVGIAMGGGGTQAALEAADIALMTDDLGKIAAARAIARRAYRTVQENLFVGVGVVHVLGITAAPARLDRADPGGDHSPRTRHPRLRQLGEVAQGTDQGRIGRASESPPSKPVFLSYGILPPLIEPFNRASILFMSLAKRSPATSCRRTSDVSRAWWIARWLLVLVVACDILSAPFHQHHHDGVDGRLGLATAHASFDDALSHAQDADHPLASHSAMAIRIDPSRLGQLPAIGNANIPVAMISVVELLASLDEPPPPQWRPDRSRPDFRSHRSLPPAGRAPPLHA